jgi:hypothetical protein
MRGASLAPQTIDTIAHTVRAGARGLEKIASLVLLAGLCTASPAFAQTTDAPFGDLARHKCGYLYGSSVELAADPG